MIDRPRLLCRAGLSSPEIQPVKSSVLVRRADPANPLAAVRDLLEGCGWRALVAPAASVVLKTHATTVFTGALKNQWGCIPRYDRILLHKYLHALIGDVNKLRPPTLALMDGLVGMQGRGPINGYPINLNVLLASRDPVALDATGMRLIGLDPWTSEHIVHGQKIGLGTLRQEEIVVDGPFAELR